jgi:indole-3-glycerol phosphate synthase
VTEARAGPDSWPKRRFSQAISEGDGISVIPLLRADAVTLAHAAAEAGAEAIAIETVDQLEALRPATELPILVRRAAADVEALRAARAAGADACVLTFAELADDDELLDELVATAADLGLDCALEVCDEEELEQALEWLDPEIFVLSRRQRVEDELEGTLDLLPDVPVGKLVVSDTSAATRDHILALERAGVDAVLVSGELGGSFTQALATLTGRA